MRRHDYETEGALRDRVRMDPGRPKVHMELAAWLVRCGRSAQAREALQSGLGEAAQTGPLYRLLGLILAGGGQLEAAAGYLTRAAAQEPTRADVLRELALVQGAAGQVAASVATLQRAAALGGGQSPLGWLLTLGEKAVAETAGRPMRRPPAPSRRTAVIESLVARDPEVAEALIHSAAGAAPTATDERRETLRAVRAALTRLTSQHPAYPDLYFGLSLVAEQLGEVRRAIREAEKAVALAPRYAEAWLLAVRLYEKEGLAAEATERCRRVTELRPRWTDAHVRLGRLLQSQGHAGEAADAYRRAVEIDPECAAAREGLAVLAGAEGSAGGEA